MARNIPIGFINAWTVDRREGEQPAIGGSFASDTNLAGSNGNVVGPNTGAFNPNLASWRRVPKVPFVAGQHMGGDGWGDGNRMTWPILGVLPDGTTVGLAFVQAEQDTPPEGVLDPSDTGAVNRTNQTVPEGQWSFGTIVIDDLDPGFRVEGDNDTGRSRVTADGEFYRVVV